MTRVLLWILAACEAVIGLIGLIGAVGLFASQPAGMATIFLPVFAMAALLLVAAAAIFVHRPWGYYVHIVVILLVGVLFVFYLGSLAGMDAIFVLLAAGAIVMALTAGFFLPSVRRYFRVQKP